MCIRDRFIHGTHDILRWILCVKSQKCKCFGNKLPQPFKIQLPIPIFLSMNHLRIKTCSYTMDSWCQFSWMRITWAVRCCNCSMLNSWLCFYKLASDWCRHISLLPESFTVCWEVHTNLFWENLFSCACSVSLSLHKCLQLGLLCLYLIDINKIWLIDFIQLLLLTLSCAILYGCLLYTSRCV